MGLALKNRGGGPVPPEPGPSLGMSRDRLSELISRFYIGAEIGKITSIFQTNLISKPGRFLSASSMKISILPCQNIFGKIVFLKPP